MSGKVPLLTLVISSPGQERAPHLTHWATDHRKDKEKKRSVTYDSQGQVGGGDCPHQQHEDDGQDRRSVTKTHPHTSTNLSNSCFNSVFWTTTNHSLWRLIDSFIYLLKAYVIAPVKCTGSPWGFSLDQILYKLNTIQKHAQYRNVKHINIIRKLVPSVLLYVKNGKES